MKSLDLQQIGLQELTTVETRSVDGGNIWLALAAMAIYDAITHPADFVEGMIDAVTIE